MNVKCLYQKCIEMLYSEAIIVFVLLGKKKGFGNIQTNIFLPTMPAILWKTV